MQDKKNWPKVNFSSNIENIPKEKKIIALKIERVEVSILERFSSWNKYWLLPTVCIP